MNPTILGFIGPGFLNQVPTLTPCCLRHGALLMAMHLKSLTEGLKSRFFGRTQQEAEISQLPR